MGDETMKQSAFLLLLTLAISLGAIVNIGDEYIGSTPMGPFRKTLETYSYIGQDYDVVSRICYHYDVDDPVRLVKIVYTFDEPDGGHTETVYEYLEFDDYRQKIESIYVFDDQWNQYPDGYLLEIQTTYKYDLQDKLLERIMEYYRDSCSERTVYEYDDRGNLVQETTYVSLYSDTVPYQAITSGYDGQNRLIYNREIGIYETIETWQTWTNHSQPDSIYTLGEDWESIQRNFFDANEQVFHHEYCIKYWNGAPWDRLDTYYQYVTAHQIYFPTQTTTVFSRVYEDGSVEELSNEVDNYIYSDDYHRVTFGDYTYVYDDNWLLAERQRAYGNLVEETITYTWEQYATPNDDPVAVPQVMVSAYPNPARGMVNISLNKSSANAPTAARIYNLKGQLVRSLDISQMSSDQYLYNWDCKDQRNNAVPAGIYLIRIKTQSGEISKKVTVLK